MPANIEAYCNETGQPAPKSPGQFARCILESLALSYRTALDEIEELTGRSIARLHIVGGGSQSALLNQFAANATGREVIAGPVEATAAGNVLIQAIALGQVESLEALRKDRERFLSSSAPSSPSIRKTGKTHTIASRNLESQRNHDLQIR